MNFGIKIQSATKKAVAVISVIAAVVLCACSSRDLVYEAVYPEETVRRGGVKAVELLDSYLNYDITRDEMESEISVIYDRIGKDYLDFAVNETFYETAKENPAMYAEREVLRGLYYIAKKPTAIETDDDLKWMREEIAANVGAALIGETRNDCLVADDDAVLEQLGLASYPGMSYLSAFVGAETTTIGAVFDIEYGYTPAEASRFFHDAISALESARGRYIISASVEYYGQPVISNITCWYDGDSARSLSVTLITGETVTLEGDAEEDLGELEKMITFEIKR